MRRILTGALALMLAVALVLAPLTSDASRLWYTSGSAGLSITQTNTNTAFSDNATGGTSTAFDARWILIRSRSASANTCYYRIGASPAAAATGSPLAPGASVSFTYSSAQGGDGWTRFGAICAAGETATWDVEAGR